MGTIKMSTELHSIAEVREYLDGTNDWSDVVIQGVDLTSIEQALVSASVSGAVFLGCDVSANALHQFIDLGVLFFPPLKDLPFQSYRSSLYSEADLFQGYDFKNPCTYCDTPDAKTYKHWLATGGAEASTITESLARRLHDHAITDALNELISGYDSERIIAVMGGHSMLRTDEDFIRIARICRTLTRDGYFLVSGGGPGTMEATHLGAWFADRSEQELDAAIGRLAGAPKYDHELWLALAYEEMEKSPPIGDRHHSLGIPTWLYGHEPPTPFATHIAKYFANSVREEGLITIAKGGIIFAKGSAGTIQEVFQDAAQNHYVTTGLVSPMIFFNEEYWTVTKPVFPLLKQLAATKEYEPLLTVQSGTDEVIDFIRSNPPILVSKTGFVYCEKYCA